MFSRLLVMSMLCIGLSACLTTFPISPVDPDAQRQTATSLAASFTREYPFSVAHLGFTNDGRLFFAALNRQQIDFFDAGKKSLRSRSSVAGKRPSSPTATSPSTRKPCSTGTLARPSTPTARAIPDGDASS